MSNDNENSNIPQDGDKRVERIEILRLEKNQIIAALKRFQTFLNNFSEDKIANLELRLRNIESNVLKDFNDVQSQLEFIDKDELVSNNREKFEDLYFEVTGQAVSIIRQFYEHKSQGQGHSQNTNLTPAISHSTNNHKSFPVIELIKFYGEYDKWSQFRDLYETLIHNDQNIDKVRKFYYLLGSLKGEASKVLESIQITADNYEIAWNMLKERYENTNLTIKNHVKALFDLPTVSKDKCSLRNLVDEFQKRFRALKLLNEPVEAWSTILIHLLTSKLDFRTATQWEEYIINKKLSKPDIKALLGLLSDRCKLLETSDLNSKSESKAHTGQGGLGKEVRGQNFKGKYENRQHGKYQSYASQFSSKSFNIECIFCKEKHFIYHCQKFGELPVVERIEYIKKLKLCLNCFRSNHVFSECIAQGCKVCSKKHNTLFHEDTNTNNDTKTIGTRSQTTGLVVNHSLDKQTEILLSTATILIQDKFKNWHKGRALLDSGSQSNFISKNFADKLKIPSAKIKIPVVGIGSATTTISKQILTKIKSCNDLYLNETNFFIVDQITENLPSISFKKSVLNLPTDITLADNNFSTSTPVDILLGVNTFYDILRPQQKRLGENLPILQETVFGWVISGLLPLSQNRSDKRIHCNFSRNSIEQQLERFWNIEEYSPKKFYTPEEIECEKIFIETLDRDETGHFVVNLPIRESSEQIGESLNSAIQRLKTVEHKFKKNPEFNKQYQDFMKEYENLGHMKKIDPKSVNIGNNGKNLFYLPHHGVINTASTTTALRVVFDGSCPSSTGVSLNNILLTGPTIQDELFSILIRFRQHNVVITADVAKMYRQVKIAESQKDLQRIVWRANPDDEISHYNLLTVTYGTAPASFLATRALQQIALENKEKYPDASDVILRDFYVDDLITGKSTVQEAIILKREIGDLLKSYGFELRKWVSNKDEIINKCHGESNDKYYIRENEISKTLGLVWHAKQDVLTYTVKNIESGKSISKRSILSCISSIFDPLGLVSPIVIRSKMLIQKLWQLKQGWDEPLPNHILTEWFNLINELPSLGTINIQRHAFSENIKRIEIHCFCDASQVAYGTCIYAKSIDTENSCYTQLLCAKSRVSPLKTISIPRLELCSAVLAVNLCEKLQQSLNLQIEQIYFWTDSTIVLSWLSLSPSKLKIFVANRVADIQSRSDRTQWGHVPTNDNPADLITRGTKVEDLKNSDLWWSGPKWLKDLNTFSWPKNQEMPNDIPEIKTNQVVLTAVVETKFNLFNKFSSLFRLLRVTAYCLRFIHNCKATNTRLSGNLTVNEINSGLTILLKIAQSEMFNINQDIDIISRKSNLGSLNPIFGPDGLLRVGGRIDKAKLLYDNKHQIILAPKHPLTKLIILNEHHKNLHSGILSLLASLRERFWIINGRRVIRSVLGKCLTCIRVKPSLLRRKMGNLPAERVTQNRPFFVSGVDFAGPFYIKDGKLRNRATIKAYLCIFICFTTKAVHLEAVGDLGTDLFLNALKRFVSRRGLCRTIFSDNGTNFTGANNELKSICNNIPKIVKDSRVSDYLLKNSITWKFIPPRSPHHGGLWEAAVKRAKYHIHRIIGKSLVTFEELSTFFAQVEAAINSSPITPLSNDPSDLSCLTPGHFLIGQPLLSIPQHDLTKLPENRLSQYQALQQRFQVFWKRWSYDYLANLQQRSKWQATTTDALKIGSMVLIMDDNLPPMYWRMGRIIKIHPGDDNITRVVTIKTSSGEFKRAVQRLCLLPIEA